MPQDFYPHDAPQPNLPQADIAPPAVRGPVTWVEQMGDEYAAKIERWNFTRDHYNGDMLDNLDKYLIRKAQGENLEAYRERKRLADYTNHFAVVVDALAGRIFAIEDDANRRYKTDESEGLGDAEDPNSDVSKLLRDSDGLGTSLLALLKLLATDLTQCLEPWILVDGGKDGEPKVKVIPPQAVTNWRKVGDHFVEAIVVDRVDVRTSLQDTGKPETQYIYYELNGWSRWRVTGEGANRTASPTGEKGAYHYENEDGVQVLPLFRAKMPLRRMVGWLLARKANVIFNKESERDHLLRACNFPKLVLVANDDLFGELKTSLAEGANVLQADPEAQGIHQYIAPASGPAQIATEALKRKVDEFYASAFQAYDDAAAEKTATEIRQDVASGEGAFLQLLSAALDDAENQIYWRVAQTLYPTDQARWFTARVERSREYLPVDANTALTNRATRYLGLNVPIPIGRDGLLSFAKQAAEYDGLTIDDEQLEAAVDAFMLGKIADASPDMPALLRVRHLLKAVAATGTVDPKEVMEMSDGEKKTLLSEIEDSATTIATAVDTSKIRDAQTFPGQ